MKYAKFERIVILAIAVAIAVTATSMLAQKTDGVEIFGQVMMLVVIVSSLYWDKRGAIASFAVSFISYTAARLIWIGDFSNGTVALLIAVKFLAYAIVALLCSFVRTQLRYFFVKMEREDLVDDETQIGNERFLARELESRIGEYERYEVPFSLLEFSLDEDFVGDMRGRGVNVLRDLSIGVLKSDTRSVDELARAQDRLVVILPNVGREGAQLCGKRLEERMRKYLGQRVGETAAEPGLRLAVYDYPEDREDVEALRGRLEKDQPGQG